MPSFDQLESEFIIKFNNSPIINDFKMKTEVYGRHNGKTIRPTCILYPYDHIIDQGFPRSIVPVKVFDSSDSKSTVAAYTLAAKYRFSEFELSGRVYKPKLSFVYNFTRDGKDDPQVWGIARSFAYFDVMNLSMYESSYTGKKGYYIRSGAASILSDDGAAKNIDSLINRVLH